MGRSQAHLRERDGMDSSGDIHPVIQNPALMEFFDAKAADVEAATDIEVPEDFDEYTMQEKHEWLNDPADPPSIWGAGAWSVTDPSSDGDLLVAWTALPAANGDAINDIEYMLDADEETITAVGESTATGDFTISGLTNTQLYSVQIRAVNDAGAGPWAVAKTGTPTV